MQSKRSRLDRFLSAQLQVPRKTIKPLLARGLIKIDGHVAKDADQMVDEFSRVVFKDKILQNKTPYYLMLHKPKGVVSATKDKLHKTVIDLLKLKYKKQLHIVGRLDFNSTGLLLLTNAGRWSRSITDPENEIKKRYKVKVEQPLTQEMVKVFSEGIYFAYENIITKPAQLTILSSYQAEVVLQEGRYHQIKRMFGYFNNKVLDIHRVAIGNICLDSDLGPSQSRNLSSHELGL